MYGELFARTARIPGARLARRDVHEGWGECASGDNVGTRPVRVLVYPFLNPCHNVVGKTSLVMVAVQGAPRKGFFFLWQLVKYHYYNVSTSYKTVC